jgi:lipopolysaccharide/colanic/teichoic acid biosynthesis glycosyltransferase
MTFVLLAVVTTMVTLLVTEGYGWLPWLAARAITWATRLLPEEHRERYEEEWLGELEALPTKGVTSLLFALRILAAAPKTARALSARLRSPVTKRALDLSTSTFILLLIAPGLAMMSAALRLESRSPILFRQRRVGRNGQVFYMLKFRSMVADAGAEIRDTRPLSELGRPFQRTDDARVTRVGRFLRRYSFDELPQLVNVLRGEMTIVGPRPRVLGEPPLDGVLGQVKPGMTRWTSLASLGYINVQEAHRRDVELATNWTLLDELRLLAANLRAMFTTPTLRD